MGLCAPRVRNRARRIRSLAALAAAGSVVWPVVVSPAEIPTIPVVSRIAGSVTVKTQTGAPHDVLSVEPVSGTELVITGESSLAAVSLAGAGSVRLGPSSSTTVAVTNGQLFFLPTTALLCAQTESNLITIRSKGSDVTPTSAATFDIAADEQQGLVVAVFAGSVSLTSQKTHWQTAAGHATVVAADGSVHDAAIPDVIARFASLKCPSADLVAAAMPSPAQASNGGGGAGAGGLLGILALLGGVVALAGSHGGSGGSGPTSSPTAVPTFVPTPTPMPTPTPTPTPTPPGAIPTPTPMPTPTPRPTPTPPPTPEPTRTHPPHPTPRPTPTPGATQGPAQSTVVAPAPPLPPQVAPAPQLPPATRGHLKAQAGLTFVPVGQNVSIAVGEPGYMGIINASVSDATTASLDRATAFGPSVRFVLSARRAGMVVVRIVDDRGESVSVTVTVLPMAGNRAPTKPR
jgi:hypothetical protein